MQVELEREFLQLKESGGQIEKWESVENEALRMQILLLRSSPPPLPRRPPLPTTFGQNNVSIRWCVRLCVCMYIQMCVHECMYIERDWPFPPIFSHCFSPLLRLYTNAGKRRRSTYICSSSSSSRLRNCDSLLSPILTHLTLPKCCLLL